jgi:LPXTG-motif cell wall-anchored protein
VPATTSVDLSISPANPGVGDLFTATVTVLSGGKPVSGGTVDFTYASQDGTDTVRNGTASTQFVAEKGRFEISARYTGQCLGDGTAIDPATDTQPIVAGVEATAGNGGGAARPGATIGGVTGSGGGGSAVGGLANTGVDSQTELYGLLGLGLVTVGGLTLMVHRRRVQG